MNPRDPRLLKQVSRPGRYLGGEVNTVIKDGPVDIRVALLFPEVYEVAASYVGFDILLHLFNRLEGVQAERVYAVWPDYEALLRRHDLPLVSLETGRPLSEFDLVGVTLQYELTATTLLTCLDLGKVPLKAADRGDKDPVVIAGGPGAGNPEPLAPFLDAVLFGDAEEAVAEVVEALREGKKEGREGIIRSLTKLPGIAIPADYRFSYRPDGVVEKIQPLDSTVPFPVRRRLVSSLRPEDAPASPVVPHLQTVHDRLSVEAVRGCTRGCRFCQAGILQRPVRERPPAETAALMAKTLQNTGLDEISLMSLSLGDYTGLPSVLSALEPLRRSSGVSLSFPSLRPGTLTREMIQQVSMVKKTGFTIAPEAGTERLRKVINKPFTDQEILETARMVYEAGWERIKTYFMIGLPTENDEDLDGIIDLAVRIAALAPRKRRRPPLTVSVSTFVPKPHTPFQWVAQISREEITHRINRLRQGLPRQIDFKTHHPGMSWLEGVMSRGDRRLAAAVLEAYRRGARFDGWSERFDVSLWETVFADVGIDPSFYANRSRDLEERLPWDYLDPLVSKDFLIGEYKLAFEGKVTPDCRQSCLGCGLQREDISCPVLASQAPVVPPPVVPPTPVDSESRYRIAYSKKYPASLLGHLDTQAAVFRALRRAGVEIVRTGGFSPHPKIVFASPPALGQEAAYDLFEITVRGKIAPADIGRRLSSVLPTGLEILAVDEVPTGVPSLPSQVEAISYQVEIPASVQPSSENLLKRIEEIKASSTLPIARTVKDRTKIVDLRPFILQIEVDEKKDKTVLLITLAVREQATARPPEILELLGFTVETQATLFILRTGLQLKKEPI